MTKLHGTSMEYGGPSHIALKYASMKGANGFTTENLMKVFPHKFSQWGNAIDSLSVLQKQGFVYERKGTWRITDFGVTFLRANAKQYVGEFK